MGLGPKDSQQNSARYPKITADILKILLKETEGALPNSTKPVSV